MEQFLNELVIDYEKQKYTLNGQDIGSLATDIHVDINSRDCSVSMTLKPHGERKTIKGHFVSEEFMKPIVHSCGNKLCEYTIDGDFYCSKCKKKVTVHNGKQR